MWRTLYGKRYDGLDLMLTESVCFFCLTSIMTLTAAVVRRFFSKRFVQRAAAEIRRGAKLI